MGVVSARLDGKRTIVTAAASGMGKAGVELFVAHGARVAAVDRNRDNLTRLVDQVTANGGVARAFVADLSDPRSTIASVEAATEWLGGVDALWSHAGMPAPSDVDDDVDLAGYNLSAAVNLTAAVLVSSAVIRTMRRQSRGAVLFTSSTSGLVGSSVSPLYSALKFGIVGLAKGLAVRYAAQGIRVNALCPGPVATPMLFDGFMKASPGLGSGDAEQRMLASIPMGRVAQPHEIAQAAMWLLSDESSFVTGVALPVDGGLTAR
jgi:NAD(P)-dependent dehydrogenase (short-subunit alcohol dehydrogenase family)